MRPSFPHWFLPPALLLAALSAFSAFAQTVKLPAGMAPGTAIGFGTLGGAFTPVDTTHPLPVAGRQETLVLASANTASAAQTVYGGSYIFAQSCTGYGSVALQLLGPDGASFQTLLTRTGADGTGGTELRIGSGASAKVVLTGTAGCRAILTRVP